MIDTNSSSRLPGFYNLSIAERLSILKNSSILDHDDLASFDASSDLVLETVDNMVENVIGVFSLPLGIALNFVVNGQDVLVPMAIEEPSVIAGASYMAKLARGSGGFTAITSEPEMIGQLQVLDIDNLPAAKDAIIDHKEDLMEEIANIDPVLTSLGGGVRDIQVRTIDESPIGPFLVVHVIYDVRDAMGANAVNTACEKLAPSIEKLTRGRIHLRILSNLADRRMAEAECMIPLQTLGFGEFTPEEVRDGIIEAWAFAAADPYRAATHNKGIMNGVDAVVIATGNDWRAVEAGAHAYASRDGRYTSLSQWGKDNDGNLVGHLEMPLAVGIVGGATRVNPAARTALKLMNISSADQLAKIIVSVGLAQNLAALRALATEGIQKGHMTLHARQVAISAGAKGDQVSLIVKKMVSASKVRIDYAQEILFKLNNHRND